MQSAWMRRKIIYLLVVIVSSLVTVGVTIEAGNEHQPVSVLGGDYQTVLSHGNQAFIAEGSFLTVLDLTDASHPNVIAHVQQESSITSLAFVKGFLATGLSKGKLQLLDVSVPTSPRIVQASGTHLQPLSLWADGEYLFVRNPRGIEILHASPEGELKRINTFQIKDQIKAMDINQGLVCLVAGGWTGKPKASFYKINEEQSLEKLGEIEMDSSTIGVSLSKDLAAISSRKTGVEVVGIADPSKPIILGKIDQKGVAGNLVWDGNHLFVPGVDPSLTIYDLTDPKTPKRIGAFKGSSGRSVWVENGKAFLLAKTLEILDVSKPTDPSLLARLTPPLVPLSFITRGNLIFVADTIGQLTSFDLSDPLSPIRQGTIPLEAQAYNLTASGTLIFAACGAGGLVVINTVNPFTMSVVTRIKDVGEVSSVMLHNEYAYLVTNKGIEGYSLSETGQMTPVCRYPCDRFTRGGTIHGNLAYLLNGSLGLQIVDLGLPFSPCFIDLKPVFGGQAFTLDGNRLFICLQDRKVLCYNLADPVHLSPPISLNLSMSQIHVRDNLLYGGNYDRINAYDITSVTAPVEVASYRCLSSSGFGFTHKSLVAADKKDGVKVFVIP
jgi:hypothetical protein